MSRRRRAEKRDVLPDPKFGDRVVSKFMNNVMRDGKKSAAERIVYGAFDEIHIWIVADLISYVPGGSVGSDTFHCMYRTECLGRDLPRSFAPIPDFNTKFTIPCGWFNQGFRDINVLRL